MAWNLTSTFSPAEDWDLWDFVEDVEYKIYLPSTDTYEAPITIQALCRESVQSNITASEGETVLEEIVFHIPANALDAPPRRLDRFTRAAGLNEDAETYHYIQEVRLCTAGTRFRCTTTKGRS